MADDFSKQKLIDDLGETLTDWSKKHIKERQVAHGATPSDEYSKAQMVTDSVAMSPSTTTTTTTTSSTASTISTTSTTP